MRNIDGSDERNLIADQYHNLLLGAYAHEFMQYPNLHIFYCKLIAVWVPVYSEFTTF